MGKWVSPAEFWQMRPYEVWWLYDAMTEASRVNNEPETPWQELYDEYG